MTRKRRRNGLGKRLGDWLEAFSLRATEWAGSSIAFETATAVVLLWILSGPLFGFSDRWCLQAQTWPSEVRLVASREGSGPVGGHDQLIKTASGQPRQRLPAWAAAAPPMVGNPQIDSTL